jgi:molecular chaperone DnaJ
MRGKDISISIEVDFMEAINGTQKTITYAKTNKCGTCKGSRMRPGTSEVKCGSCDGTGF